MTKEEFIRLVTEHVLEYLPESYQEKQVEVTKRAKNNDIILHGLTIRGGKEGTEAVPMLYLDDYYDSYRFGNENVEDVVHQIAEDYRKAERSIPSFDLPEMTREGIKDKTFVKLVNTRSNRDRLRDLASLPAEGGFSLTAYIDLGSTGQGAMIQITRDMAERMDYPERELMQDAMQNTCSRHPAELVEMDKIMMDIAGLRKLSPGDNLLAEKPAPAESLSMLILTNADKFFGAAALFYPEVKQQIADVTGGSYYILPSSVHELIILPDNGSFNEQELASMVQSVNSAEVQPEEQLGNKVLFYNAAMVRLMVAVDLDKEQTRGKER